MESTDLGIEEPKKNSRGDQQASPDKYSLDTKVARIRADHVGDSPLEDNTKDDRLANSA